MFALRIAALVAATLATGLIAGVFYAYAISVMPALGRADDRTIIDVMQKINVVIINPWFLIGFVGTLVFGIAAAALHLGADHRATLIWIGIALALNVIAFAVTGALNVPLNDQLASAGDVAALADPAAVRADFESAWIRWNIVRAVLHTLALLVLCGALFTAGAQHGRAAASSGPSVSSRPSVSSVSGAGTPFADVRPAVATERSY
ncbi:anthrone oxygenase family protein [Nocardia sp. NPDC005366]|uniref:anthrone oxygenase family protein n=1 Tax=Nocardia sp. NPDC005366 TaxID=3156878 RepID=UPI00339EE2E4